MLPIPLTSLSHALLICLSSSPPSRTHPRLRAKKGPLQYTLCSSSKKIPRFATRNLRVTCTNSPLNEPSPLLAPRPHSTPGILSPLQWLVIHIYPQWQSQCYPAWSRRKVSGGGNATGAERTKKKTSSIGGSGRFLLSGLPSRGSPWANGLQLGMGVTLSRRLIGICVLRLRCVTTITLPRYDLIWIGKSCQRERERRARDTSKPLLPGWLLPSRFGASTRLLTLLLQCFYVRNANKQTGIRSLHLIASRARPSRVYLHSMLLARSLGLFGLVRSVRLRMRASVCFCG